MGHYLHYLILSVLTGFSFGQEAQENAKCTTPNNLTGACISVYNCKILLDILRQGSNLSATSRDFIRKSGCGFKSATPYVCCPHQETSRNPNVLEPPSLKYNFLSPPNCGRSNATLPRVVNGVAAQLGAFPWVTALGYRNRNNPAQPKWLCGSSLITHKHLLTAAHCVQNRPDLYLARVGDLDLYDDEDGAEPTDIEIVQAKIHENYNPTKFLNDISILTLAKTTENLVSVWPICLPWQPDKRERSYNGFLPLVAGWGRISYDGPSSSILMLAQLPVVDNTKCAIAYAGRTTIDDTVLCAGYDNAEQDACRGDSGGPLMYGVINGTGIKSLLMYQIGVVSYGYLCAEKGYPGVYTRVTQFLDWIGENTK